MSESEYWINCEKLLFNIITSLMSKKDIECLISCNSNLIGILSSIKDSSLNKELLNFKSLPKKVQESTICGLQIRLNRYLSD